MVGAINRRPPDGTSDLWTLEQVGAVPFQPYTFPILTFAPVDWAPVPFTPPSLAAYKAAFALKYPIIQKILPMRCSASSVVVAGGAAAWPISAYEPWDVDLFITGAGEALWNVADELVRRLSAAAIEEDPGCSFERGLYRGVLTIIIIWSKPGRRQLKVQAILRDYDSVGAVLHQFDVPSCAVAYDGEMVLLTGIAAYAHAFKVNLVDPKKHSPNYAWRLAKYFERGFALGLVQARPDLFVTGAPELHLPHLDFLPTKDSPNTDRLVRGKMRAVECSSYEQPMKLGCDHLADYSAVELKYNLQELFNGTNRFLQLSRDSDLLQPRDPPLLSELIPQKFITERLDHMLDGLLVLSHSGVQRLAAIGFTSAEATVLADDANKWVGRRLKSLVDAFLEEIDMVLEAPVEWVLKNPIGADSNRQPKTPAQWYGADNTNVDPAAS